MTAFFEIAGYTYRKTLGLLLFCIKGALVGFLQLVTVENGGWGKFTAFNRGIQFCICMIINQTSFKTKATGTFTLKVLDDNQ